MSPWRTTTDPASWFKSSVVWYSQQVITHMDPARFQNYVLAFDYGNGDQSGDAGKHNAPTRARLSSLPQISLFERLTFLRSSRPRNYP